jgi:hypothetical protein
MVAKLSLMRSNTAELSEGARGTVASASAAPPEATAPLATFDSVFAEAFRFGGMLLLDDHNTMAVDHKIKWHMPAGSGKEPNAANNDANESGKLDKPEDSNLLALPLKPDCKQSEPVAASQPHTVLSFRRLLQS